MDNYAGEIRMVGFNFAPRGWALCDGRLLPIEDNLELFDLLGAAYGGDGETTFGLPDLQGRIPVGVGHGDGLSNRSLAEQGGTETVAMTTDQLPGHSHPVVASQDVQTGESPAGAVPAAGGPIELYTAAAPEVPLSATSIRTDGGGQPHDNLQPYLVVNFIISLQGASPAGPLDSTDPFVGEIRMMGAASAPSGWAPCAGQLVAIPQAIQLYTLLGTQFGGNGRTTFALPDLVDAVPMGSGQGAGLSGRDIGDSGGTDAVTLIAPELPQHTHAVMAMPGQAGVAKPSPATTLAASAGGNAYSSDTGGLAPLADQALASAGGGLPHNNLQPYLALDYYVAMQGTYPPRG